jgi:membrane protein implicated in regulation of membrane protease activity
MPFAPDWYFLGFLAPLILGLLIVLGLALGMGHDLGHGDAELHGDADGHDALSVLGFGRTPFLLVLTMLLLWFGGAGLVCWFFAMPVLLALPTASVVSYGLSRASAGVISQLLPSLETTSVKARDLRGLSGVVTLEAAPGKPGLAHVTKGGDIYQINFTCNEHLLKGQRVLILDVNAETDVYSVCLDPTDPKGNEKWKWL